MAKATLKDIAKEAGVSTATVSYVLNNIENQKISEDVRKKIIQISLLLGYTKNIHANALSKGCTNLIGIYLGISSFSLINSEGLKYLTEVTKTLKENNYDVVFLPFELDKTINYCDAILCILLSDEEFNTVCNNNYIPVIAIDTNAKHPWNFEIITTYSEVKNTIGSDDYKLVLYRQKSKYIEDLIIKANGADKVMFVDKFEDLEFIKSIDPSTTIVTPYSSLFNYLKPLIKNIFKYKIDTTKKLNAIVKCIKLAVDHVDTDEHRYDVE